MDDKYEVKDSNTGERTTVIRDSVPKSAAPKIVKSKKVMVQRLSPSPVDGRLACVDMDNCRLYLIAVADCDFARSSKMEIDLDQADVIEGYNWETEIKAMLPSTEAIKDNIRLSIWRAGGYTVENTQRRAKFLKSAFPYKFTNT